MPLPKWDPFTWIIDYAANIAGSLYTDQEDACPCTRHCNLPPVDSKIVVNAVVDAIKLGYRRFDTTTLYQTEHSLGDAIAEAFHLGLINSCEELFITSKLWCSDAHADHVLPALQNTLNTHTCKFQAQWKIRISTEKEDVLPMDMKSMWAAMEECQSISLTKSIGVSNFSCKKIADVIAFAKITPAVNQVELNPLWPKKKLVEFCKPNGILDVAFSSLGGAGTNWGSNNVMESEVRSAIAKAKGKSVAQSGFVDPEPSQRNQLEKISLKNLPKQLSATSSVDVRSLNNLSKQGYPNKFSSIGRTPGCGRFTVVGVILGVIFSADDRNLGELPRGPNERDRLALEYSPSSRDSNAVNRDCKAFNAVTWIGVVMKSFNKERLEQNIDIFDWGLSEDETKMINELPQNRVYRGEEFVDKNGPIKSVEELWDGEV
ncbi:hypothetical protein LguiB_027261 [Lonicera macranthoides]